MTKTIQKEPAKFQFDQSKPDKHGKEKCGVSRFLLHKGTGDSLFVLIHGYNSTADSMFSVANIVKGLGDPTILLPEYFASFISYVDPNAIARDITRKIKEIDSTRISRIVFIGHSLGALLARKVYICAIGENEYLEEVLCEFKEEAEWKNKVDRIVLLAGMNRGWQLSHQMSVKNLIFFKGGELLHTLFLQPIGALTGKRSLIFSIRRGASFITQLRLQWLKLNKPAPTIQLLGTIDDLVSPEDNADLITGSDFIYIDVPHTNHINILEVEIPNPDKPKTIKEARGEKVKNALTQEIEALQKQGVDLGDLRPLKSDESIKQVFFVIHGIRDRGYWTQRIARKIKSHTTDKNHTATETSTYGYFPMLPFILPGTRRSKVEWLMDQYTENKALYPKAVFHYVGHSNGTYLLAKALEEYRACKFEHVVFAGSVVRRNYPWKKMKARKQVVSVLNFVATGDWVVAFFPKLFQVLRLPPFIPYLQDLGSAGHDGFFDMEKGVKGLYEIKYVFGDHGAAIREDNWDAIAEFIAKGTLSNEILSKSLLKPKQNRLIAALGMAPYIVWLSILAFAIFIGYLLVPCLTTIEWIRVIALGAFLWVIYSILTRV